VDRLLGIKNLNWRRFGSSSIYKYGKTFRMRINSIFFSKKSYFKVFPSLLRFYVFLLLHQVEERKGEDGDGRNRWHNMSVVVMSFHNMSVVVTGLRCEGEIWRALAPTRFVRLVFGLPDSVLILRLTCTR